MADQPEVVTAQVVAESPAQSRFQPPPPREAPPGEPPAGWREIVCAVLLVVLCDLTMYRGYGPAGYALLFFAAPWLLLAGSPQARPGRGFWLLGGMLILLAGRTLWLGSALTLVVGFNLLAAVALAIAGRTPYVGDVCLGVLRIGSAGCRAVDCYFETARRLAPRIPRWFWLLNAVLPLVALVVFGTLFVLANPDLVASFSDWLGRFFKWLGDLLARFLPDVWEVLFWLAAFWVAAALLRPVLKRESMRPQPPSPPAAAGEQPAPLYAALRNTLAAVILLFAVYLVFEFKTLWFRNFPKGFYYAGYAHEGAAWLTVALGMATAVLSLTFRGPVLRDPRLTRLRRLAWIWSAENLILSATVFNRLFIYIDFNGMTRMRTVGLFGAATVVAGFLLVVWKIVRGHSFVWLIQRHLWTLAVAIFLYSLTPVDMLVHAHNVRHVLAGDIPPAVQICTHPIDAEGVLMLRPLAHCDDAIIREGIRAMLAKRAIQAEAADRRRRQQGWTTYQIADRLLLEQLRSISEDWEPYTDAAKREAAITRFYDYVYPWY